MLKYLITPSLHVILHHAVAVIGFVTSPYLFPEDRPQENIDVKLFNDIVTGRSVTVTVVEQGTLLHTLFTPYEGYQKVSQSSMAIHAK